jgi:hypothetical protein
MCRNFCAVRTFPNFLSLLNSYSMTVELFHFEDSSITAPNNMPQEYRMVTQDPLNFFVIILGCNWTNIVYSVIRTHEEIELTEMLCILI